MSDRTKILIAVGVFAILFLLTEWLKQRKKDRLPTVTIRATVRSKSVFAQTVSGPYGRRNALGYRVTFDLVDGSRVELNAPENFGKHPDGTTGILTFQGNKFERFDPDL